MQSIMLPSARRSVARTLVQSKRMLSAAPKASRSTMQEALSKVESIATGETGSFKSVAALPSRAPASSSDPKSPPVMSIPPAEDPILHFLTSLIQKSGRRQRAANITARTLMFIHTLTRAPPLPILREAISIVAPAVRCISSRHAGRTMVYPRPLSEKQRYRYALTWILDACDARPGQHLEERLAREVVAIVQGSTGTTTDFSPAMRRKEEVHKLATANRGNVQRPRS